MLDHLPEENRNQRDADDQQIEQIEGRPTEGAVVEQKSIRDDLQHQFNGENGCEKVIEVVENLISFGIRVQRILGGQHG